MVINFHASGGEHGPVMPFEVSRGLVYFRVQGGGENDLVKR